MATSQNKLTPVLVGLAIVIVCYLVYSRSSSDTKPVASGQPLSAAPLPGVDPASAPKTAGIFGGAPLPPVTSADADNSNETLTQVTASNKELREAVQKVVEQNQSLIRENEKLKRSDEEIVSRVRTQLQAELMPSAAPTSAGLQGRGSSPTGLIDNGVNAAAQIISGLGAQPGTSSAGTPLQVGNSSGTIPTGLGYDGVTNPSSMINGQGIAPQPAAGLTKVIAPLGYRTTPGVGESGPSLARNNLTPARPNFGNGFNEGQSGAALQAPGKPEPEPYYTLPENSTLTRATAMTALVGRVPIDGRVQDPMQFKLVIGRENLAASGQFIPDDISGIVVSGIAIGDMALSCTEGLIQSLTFVFDDGTVRTVSQRSNGATPSSNSNQSIASASKLGWISDEFGNPCVPGKFVTNAPAYLTDVIGAKALSAAGAAIAAAETTTTNGASALGSTSTTTVTGSKGRNVLGKVASAGSDEVVNWLTRRLNNSFDAVVVKAGARVAVHIEQSIAIDKEPDGRRLDYARGRSSLAQQQGVRHGMD